MKSPTTNYIAICATARFLAANAFLFIDSHQKPSNHQKASSGRSEHQISHISQKFLKSSATDFVKKITKAFLSADIPLGKLNNKHIKNLFSDMVRS